MIEVINCSFCVGMKLLRFFIIKLAFKVITMQTQKKKKKKQDSNIIQSFNNEDS